MCYRTGKYTVCRRVRAAFSPEILQAVAVKKLKWPNLPVPLIPTPHAPAHRGKPPRQVRHCMAGSGSPNVLAPGLIKSFH